MSEASITPRVVSGLGDDGPSLGDAIASSPRGPSLPVIKLDPRTYARALDCIHCGLCLPACPTYMQNGLEGDSPRGRIILMKGLADGRIEPTPGVREHLDLCLDCRACETACPSGVVYHELIEETRAKLPPVSRHGLSGRLTRWMFLSVAPYPSRFRPAILPARLLQKIGLWSLLTMLPLPLPIKQMMRMLPRRGRLWEGRLAAHYPAQPPANWQPKQKLTVGMFAGCVGSVLFQEVNRQTIRLLQHAGCDVVVPQTQGCCGAIHFHSTGPNADTARALARANIDAFFSAAPGPGPGAHPDGSRVDVIVNNIAGCGAMLADYGHLLRDDPAYATRAAAFAGRVRDINQLLVELAPPRPQRPMDRTVTYHDACHLAHAQRIVDAPRQLLSWVSGLAVVPLHEADMCCGAAGTYNLTQPEMAHGLGRRKLDNIRRTGATMCVTANAGCAMQIQNEAERAGVKLRVVHPVTLLHEAYFG